MKQWVHARCALLALLVPMLFCAACGGPTPPARPGSLHGGVPGAAPVWGASEADAPHTGAAGEDDTGTAEKSADGTASAPPKAECYFERIARQTVQGLGLTGGESSIDKIKAAYKHIIAETSYIEYDQPELVEHWRYEDACETPPTALQVAGAGPLLYGIGTCEQYSAALVLLLEHMGFEALYVTGLTNSVQGGMVDHAWVMVKVDGQWYHIDPQLEDNVMRDDVITYYYFLKGDEDFLPHHRWGAHLQKPNAYSLALPACPASQPWQPAESLAQKPPPDVQALVQAAAKKQAAHTGAVSCAEVLGALPPLPRDMQK